MSRVIFIHKFLLLMLVAAITVIFFRSQGTNDINTWITWGRHAYEHGIIEGYAIDGNLYPPFANVLLWLSYSFAMFANIAPVVSLKFFLLIFLLATTVIFYVWSNKNLAATLCFYSAMLLSSLGLGYLDIYFASVLLYSLYCLERKKITHFAFFFTLACLIKFPPILVAPFFIVYLFVNTIRPEHKITDFKLMCRKAVLPSVVLLAVVLLIFGKTFIIALLKTANAAWLSAWALNFNWIVTRIYLVNGWGEAYPPWFEATVAIMSPVPENARVMARILYLFFFGSTLLAFLFRSKTMENLLLYSVLSSFSYFMFYTGVHENHLFLASVLAMALFCVNQKYLYLSFGILVISSLNMFVFYGASGGNAGGFLFHPDMSIKPYSYWTDAPLLLALANTLYFLVLWCSVVGNDALSFMSNRDRNKKAPR